jgi:hypothetical protein
LKLILPANQNFQGVIRLILSKYPYSAKLKKHRYLSGKTTLWQKQVHIAYISLGELSEILKRILPE